MVADSGRAPAGPDAGAGAVVISVLLLGSGRPHAHEDLAGGDRAPRADGDVGDGGVGGRVDVVLHLHRLQDDQQVALAHPPAGLDADAGDDRLHGRGDDGGVARRGLGGARARPTIPLSVFYSQKIMRSRN